MNYFTKFINNYNLDYFKQTKYKLKDNLNAFQLFFKKIMDIMNNKKISKNNKIDELIKNKN